MSAAVGWLRRVAGPWSVLPVLAACTGGALKAPEDGLVREDLGTVTTDTGAGADVAFEVPTDAWSALVTCGPYGYDVLATAESLVDPDGAAIYDYNDPEGTPVRVGTTSDLLPVLLPVSPDLDLSAGTYGVRVHLGVSEPTAVSCSALYRIEEPTAGQTVDLHLVFVGVSGDVPGLDALAAVDNDALNATLERVDALWADLGLAVGVVTYEDFAGDVATYASVDGTAELGGLLRTATSDDPQVTVFLVQGITDDDGAPLLAWSGGPPGAAAVGGTSKSGVVLTVSSLVDTGAGVDTDAEAHLLAHEVGHFLGLYHPIEPDGSGHDPLSDTPECGTDADGNGVYDTTDCYGQGADFLMWWAMHADAIAASPDQAWVAQRSAALR